MLFYLREMSSSPNMILKSRRWLEIVDGFDTHMIKWYLSTRKLLYEIFVDFV